MTEQSPEVYVDALSRRFNRQKRLREFILDVAMSSVMIMSPSDARIVFDEIHKTDTLPHD